jgi:phosphatidylinositol glycan class B
MLSTKSRKYIYWGLFFHLLAIIFTKGFYRHDEQREVLQVVGHALGFYDASYLSVQFHAMIRPWLQPLMYVLPSKLYLILFKPDPFHLAVLYRLISSVIGVASLWVLYKCFEERFKEAVYQNWYFFFAAFLWFIPFIHARTSNENLCSSFFIFGLYYLIKDSSASGHWNRALIAGFMFGISFILRFQMAVMIAPTVLWFLIFKRYSFKKYLLLSLSFLLFVGISTAIDSYYYGKFTFAPYNYFYINIVQKYAAEFGVSPWYDYFVQGFKEGVPPLSILFIFTYIILWIRFPMSLMTWITLPFFIVHCLIGHKEFRFLFPMILLLPAIFTMLIQDFKLQIKRLWIILFQVFNIPLLIFFTMTSASSMMSYYEYLYYKTEPVTKVFVSGPFEDFTKFYLKNDIKYVVYSPTEVPQLAKSDARTYFLTRTLSEQHDVLNQSQCRIDFSLYPQWIYELEFIKKRRTFRSYSLIECVK